MAFLEYFNLSILRTWEKSVRKVNYLPSSNVLSSKSSPLRSQESLGNGFPPSVMQVSLTLSPDLCSGRKSPWIWGGEGGSVMQKFNRITNWSLLQFSEFWLLHNFPLNKLPLHLAAEIGHLKNCQISGKLVWLLMGDDIETGRSTGSGYWAALCWLRENKNKRS